MMLRTAVAICFLIISVFLMACVQINVEKVDVRLGDRTTLYFTGRGAAAGIMMDSLLGGTGVAIGIAIDEGIAKDISTAILANNPNFSMKALTEDLLYEQMGKNKSIGSLKAVIIEKYGFKSAADDTVIPLLELKLTCASGLVQDIRLSETDSKYAIPFDKVKTDGALAEKKLYEAVHNVFSVNEQICSS